MRVGVVLVAWVLVAAGCGSTQHATITATPRSTLIDQAVAIRVHGVKPGSLVSIRLVDDGWIGRGVYRAARDGTVDVARDKSVAGTYSGRDPMGLFWSMLPPTTPSSKLAGPLELTASVGGKQAASTTLVRHSAAAGVTERTETVANDGFDGEYDAPPPNVARGAPVLVFGGSEGGIHGGEAALLASHGHPALALAYFDEPDLPPTLQRIPLEYFARAARWLDRQPGVDPKRLVVWGTSRGSEAALELGVHYPELFHAVIGGVASNVVFPGLTAYDYPEGPAWTFGGKPIPNGTIPVERIRGPVFVFGAGADALWHSYDYVPEIAERSTKHHGPPVTAIVYPGTGHWIGNAVPNLPMLTTITDHGQMLRLGGTAKADQAALVNLWPRLLHFLAVVPGR
jgi:dienelactone hydrolase